MNYSERHSHKWSRIFKEARKRVETINSLYKQNKINEAKNLLNKLYNGEFNNPDKIFPGLKIMAPYWKSVEGEMECRFDTLYEYSNLQDLTRESDFDIDVKKLFALFLDDVKEILARDKTFDYKLISNLIEGGFEKFRLPTNWDELYKSLRDETEPYLTKGRFPDELLDRWFLFCLRGVLAYDYNLIRQAVFVAKILKKFGEDRVKNILERSRDDFGWRVSRLFFLDMFPKAGITDAMELMTLGRYAMFCDQDLKTEEKKLENDIKLKTSVFYNCQEFSIFNTISKYYNLPLKIMGLGICIYCEEHAKKNTLIFVPPSMRPALKLIKALGYGDEVCQFETKLYPANDMERFMQAQDKLYGNQ